MKNSHLRYFGDFVNHSIRTRFFSTYYFLIGFCIFFGIFVIDITSPYTAAFEKYGAYLWVFSYLLIGIYAAVSLTYILHFFQSRRYFITLLTLGGVTLLVLFNAAHPRNISGEITQEIACSLNHILTDPGHGYNKTCLFGYPMRQFLLPAVPTLIGGISLFNLNLGGALYFIVGSVLFTAGIMQYLDSKKHRFADQLSAASLIILFQVYHVNFLLFNFEQSVFPLGFTLMLTGLFLSFMVKKRTYQIVLMGFLLLYLIYTYTTGLFVFFLSIGVSLWVIWQIPLQISKKVLIAVIIICSLCSYLWSLQYRSDINFMPGDRTGDLIFHELSEGLLYLTTPTTTSGYVSTFLQGFFVLAVLSVILYGHGFEGLLIGIWIIAIFIFSIVSKGYAYYAVEYRLHRSVIIFPILIAFLITQIQGQTLFQHITKKQIHTVLIIIIFMSAMSVNRYLQTKKDTIHYQLIQWLKAELPYQDRNGKSIVYFDTGAIPHGYDSLYDKLQYFLPNVSTQSINANCDTLEADIQNNPTTAYFVFVGKHMANPSCFEKKEYVWRYVDNYTPSSTLSMDLYRIRYAQ